MQLDDQDQVSIFSCLSQQFTVSLHRRKTSISNQLNGCE